MSGTTPSGRYLLRIEPALHERLRGEAMARRLSLNELCAGRLARRTLLGGSGVMRNDALGADYVRRAEVRLRALDTLFDGESRARRGAGVAGSRGADAEGTAAAVQR